jgi:hypothetical protein
VRPGKSPRSTRLRSDYWVAAGNGAHTYGIARVSHVPDLVRGIGVGVSWTPKMRQVAKVGPCP